MKINDKSILFQQNGTNLYLVKNHQQAVILIQFIISDLFFYSTTLVYWSGVWLDIFTNLAPLGRVGL